MLLEFCPVMSGVVRDVYIFGVHWKSWEVNEGVQRCLEMIRSVSMWLELMGGDWRYPEVHEDVWK